MTGMLDSLKSGTYDDMDNDELYEFVLRKRYNVLFSNLLLLLVKITNFEDRGADRLQEKGFKSLRQQEERDVRDLRRNVEKKCKEFLRSLSAAGVPFQEEKGKKGVLTSAGLNKSIASLAPSTHQSGFHYNLRLSFLNLVHFLNGAYTFRSRGLYDVDRKELTRAFRFAARHLEWALAQHVTSARRRFPEEDLAISSQLSSLTITNGSRETNSLARPRIPQTRMAPAPAPSSAYPQSPPSTPPRLTSVSSTTLSRVSPRSPPPAAPRLGVLTPAQSPQAARSSQYRSAPPCTNCKQIGHSYSKCPKTECYKCKYSKTEEGYVVLLFYCTTITTGERELTICAF